MHGNIFEWCEDWHEEYPFAIIDPKGPGTGNRRVLRGRCFYGRGGSKARSSARGGNKPTYRVSDGGGFRLARTK